MFIVTFYSFKGGVGRTLALVNVAAHLAQSGKTVLIVDFDLEAPGITTFDPLRKADGNPGVVDFIHDYLQSNESPDVNRYLTRCSIGEKAGSVWVMPAGLQDGCYGNRLRNIDWNYLYDRRSGYLLFEDLKMQWKEAVCPDYVLIDSRTGHTDVGGICTRQLPDSVVLMFFLNEQNLSGLQQVVHDIRCEREPPINRRIAIQFVASDVPDLDDENGILGRRLQEFRDKLKCDVEPVVVHHYNSLTLLDQEIFTVRRPASSMSREYGRLADRIRSDNPADREAALEYLRGSIHGKNVPRRVEEVDSQERRLTEIASAHPKDGEVLLAASVVWARQAEMTKALDLVNSAIEVGSRCADAFLHRAMLSRQIGDVATAVADSKSILACSDAEFSDLMLAVNCLRDIEPASLDALRESVAFLKLPIRAKAKILDDLSKTSDTQIVAKELLCRIHEKVESRDADSWTSVSIPLAILQISLGEFEDAIRTLNRDSLDPTTVSEIAVAFNVGMAEWGRDKKPSLEWFGRVVELDALRGPNLYSNYEQCLALANYVSGDTQSALRRLDQAEKHSLTDHGLQLSCWTYQHVDKIRFQIDLREMRKFFMGEGGGPIVVERKVQVVS